MQFTCRCAQACFSSRGSADDCSAALTRCSELRAQAAKFRERSTPYTCMNTSPTFAGKAGHGSDSMAAVCLLHRLLTKNISPFLHLPMAKFIFAVYPVRNLPSASETLADGKLKICNRQVRRWPSAKFMSDKWQNKILPSANCYFLNGKTCRVFYTETSGARQRIFFCIYLFEINERKNAAETISSTLSAVKLPIPCSAVSIWTSGK